MKKRNKGILIAAVVVVVVALVIVNLVSKGTKATTVQADKVIRKSVTETVSASGRIQPKTKVDITSEVNGEILALKVREGDQVKTGDLLVVLDTVQLRSDVDQALYAVHEGDARLSASKSQLAQAEEEFQRQQRLFENKLNSETTFKNAQYAHESALANYAAAEAQANQYRARYEQQVDNLSKAKIAAPMSGIITYLGCEVGEIAAPQTLYSQGKTLMTISNLDVFEVEVEVDETEINKVEVGQKVKIEVDAFPDTSFAGQVVEVGNTAMASTANQSTNFRVKVIFSDPNVQLRPGMSATVDVTTAVRENALTVPYSAVVMRSFDVDSLERARRGVTAESTTTQGQVQAAEVGDQDESAKSESSGESERKEIKGVFLVRGGKARFAEISTGIADQKRIEVLTGVNESDTVISGPYRVLRTVKEGDEIKTEGMGGKGEGVKTQSETES